MKLLWAKVISATIKRQVQELKDSSKNLGIEWLKRMIFGGSKITNVVMYYIPLKDFILTVIGVLRQKFELKPRFKAF